jgi:hypothetical protein
MSWNDCARATRAGILALMLVAAGCGRQDSGSTVDTGSRSDVASAVRVADVKLGRSVGSDKRLTDETDNFRPTDVVYAVVETQGSGAPAELRARWTYEDGQVVDESSRNISAAGGDFTEFHISKPSGWPRGKYQVEILLNGQSVETEDFEVK